MRRIIIAGCVILLAACRQGKEKEQTPVAPAGPVKWTHAMIKYAHGFAIEYHDRYKLLHVYNPNGEKTDTLDYVLLPAGAAVPPGFEGGKVIRTPVSSMVVMASTHVALADFAGVTDRITGLGSFQYINNPLVRERIKQGKVSQVGLDGNLNNELLITMHPGLVMAMNNPEAGQGKYKQVTDAGIPVIMNAEWLESTPLGKAEWVKLMAALVDKEELVNRKFDSLEEAYQKMVAMTRTVRERPRVIIGMPYKGSWFVPAGDSYMSHFLQDAGASYKWADTKGTGSIGLNFEAVAPEALEADYWLNIGYVENKKEILAKDPRYAGFKSFKTGEMFNNSARTNDLGSNDYWESGVVSPQVILADMIRILHPELLPDHQLVYYKQMQ